MSNDSTLVWPLRHLVGHRILSTDKDGVITTCPGEAIGFRDNGNQVLFAQTPPIPEDITDTEALPKHPAVWIPITEFCPSPLCLTYAHDFMEPDEDDVPVPLRSVPAKGDPMGPKRRGK